MKNGYLETELSPFMNLALQTSEADKRAFGDDLCRVLAVLKTGALDAFPEGERVRLAYQIIRGSAETRN